MIKIFQNSKSALINNACCQYFKELRNLMKTPHISAYIIYNKWIPTTAKINIENSKQSKFCKSCQMKYFIWPEINSFFMFSLYGKFLEKCLFFSILYLKGRGVFHQNISPKTPVDFLVIYEFHDLKRNVSTNSLFIWATYNDVCLVKCNSEAQFYKGGHNSNSQSLKRQNK